MTKIKMLNDRIIFDGHADTRQECETITLMCDNLAKSKDFKTIRYESGYAEFEKVGKTKELKFIPNDNSVGFEFDEHITKVVGTVGGTEFEWATSGAYNVVSNGDAASILCTVYFDGQYKIASIEESEEEYMGGSSSITGDNTFVLNSGSYGSISKFIITSEPAATKQTIDVSTLAGWANLATGNHQITIKTKASGYVDSAASNAVTVSKAASGYKLTIINNSSGGGYKPSYTTNVGSGEFENEVETKVINGVTSISSFVVNQTGLAPEMKCFVVSEELGINLVQILDRPGSLDVITTATTITKDTTITVSNSQIVPIGHTVTFDDQETGGASGFAYYSLDDGATWRQFCAILSDTDNDLFPTSLSNTISIKFKIEVDYLGLPPFGVKLVCSEIGMSLGGKNTGTFISDNYTLTKDITVIITT